MTTPTPATVAGSLSEPEARMAAAALAEPAVPCVHSVACDCAPCEHRWQGGETVGVARLSRSCMDCGDYEDTGPTLRAGAEPTPAAGGAMTGPGPYMSEDGDWCHLQPRHRAAIALATPAPEDVR